MVALLTFILIYGHILNMMKSIIEYSIERSANDCFCVDIEIHRHACFVYLKTCMVYGIGGVEI